MNTWKRFVMASVLLAGLGGLLLSGARSAAGDDDEKRMNEVQAIADALQAGKMDMAVDLAKKLAKKEIEDKVPTVGNVMALMKPRDKKTKSFGFGKKPGELGPDGIELQLSALGRDLISVNKLKKEKEALEEMVGRMKAIGLFAENQVPPKAKGLKATKANWVKYAQELQESVGDMEKAVKSESPAELKKAATNVNAKCTQCHDVWPRT